MPRPEPTPSTRERLMTEGLRLFAERGYRGTRVGDIEAAAGLAPRRGAMYRHFPSKRDLLEAAVDEYIRDLETISGVIDLMPLTDLRAELTLLARWILRELDRQREIVLIFEKDGDELADLRDRFFEQIVTAGYLLAADYVGRIVASRPHLSGLDAEVVAAAAMNAVVTHRRGLWTFGSAPLGLDDERFLRGLVDQLARLLGEQDAGGSAGPAAAAPRRRTSTRSRPRTR